MRQYKLVADIGNSFAKLARFEGKYLVDVELFPSKDTEAIREWVLKQKGIKSAILSTVVDLPPEMLTPWERFPHFIKFGSQIPLPVKNYYRTPVFLGKDRLAAAVGGNYLFPGEDCLVINMGTCIICDFVTGEGHYRGGSISPGLEMRLKSLHTFTARLPLVNLKEKVMLTGNNSRESILSGVVNGISYELDGFIGHYLAEYPKVQVILSGGDAPNFVKRLKSPIFAVPNIVLIGLNEILDHNV